MLRFLAFRLPGLLLGISIVWPCRSVLAAQPAVDDWRQGNLVANGDFHSGPIGALPEGWTLKAPNPALRPQFKLTAGAGGERLLEAAGNGRTECFGCLARAVDLAAGKTYRLRVRFRFEGFEDVNRHLLHGVFASGFNDGIFSYRKDGDWVIGENRFPGPAKAVRGEMRLYFRYSPQGKVWWSGVSLQECEAIKPRPVKIAVCQGGGDRKRWEKFLDTAGAKHCDVALMTEFFEEGIQTADGPSMKFMSQKARQWKMYVCGTIRMKRGDVVYNSAPLWDRQGQLVGIYDKFMLYDPELDDGTTPGESMPVFQADFGKVGVMTCYDSWHPEVARLLAYKGAELILFPSAGYYMQLMHARAADNGVAIAASSGSPCGVWDSAGNPADGGSPDPTRYAPTAILACEKDDSQKMQIVTLDLSKKPSPHSWGGPMLSAPGGRRVRATGRTHLEDEIARESRRWWDEPLKLSWRAGIGRRVITPHTPVWLAGYGTKREPAGKIHDLWVKVLALRAPNGKRVVMATTDHMGMSKTIYESLYAKVNRRFSLDRSEFMLTFSHNHCGPVLKDDLVDYYPLDAEQRRLVAEYSDWMEDQVVEAVDEALSNLQPAQLLKGEGKCTFAVNRRENAEAEVPKMLAEGRPLKGVVDHSVPVLAVRGTSGKLLGVLFGYACHPTTLSSNAWCGDYPGFAQVNVEANHPGAAAMFFNACGGDQNPIPRRKVELCQRYGKMLSDAVEEVLSRPMQPVSGGLWSAFEFVHLAYDELVTREKLLPIANGNSALHARWAKRMLKMIDEGAAFPTSYPYPIQAWRLGNEILLIGIGGEAVVDYSLRFKREFGPTTWVCGYANDMAAYIPSRRVWNEGGYEGGPHLDEYGRPAWRWAGDVEDRIARAVHRVVQGVRAAHASPRTLSAPR